MLFFLGLCLSSWSPPAISDIEEIQRLTANGSYEEALAMTNQVLAQNEGNITYRFLKGLILTRMDQLEQARDVFIEITETNPDLPEPYNNLAVIYASLGDYDKARQLLERAINTHPAYATAYENIGDIYAKLASKAYNQALELDRENISARAKLSLVNDLFSLPESPDQTVVADAGGTDTAGVQQVAVVEPEPEPVPEPVSEPEPEPVPDIAGEPAQIVVAVASEPVPQITDEEIRRKEQELARQNQILQSQITTSMVKQSVLDWAAAWSRQDVDAYLSFYANDFSPGNGQTIEQWRATRRDRVSAPYSIEVVVSDLAVEMLGNDHASATFTQVYQSDVYGDRVKKTLLMKLERNNWRITQEQTQ